MTPSPGDREKDRDTPGTDAEAGEALLSLRGKDGSAEKAKGKQRKAYTITKARERWTDSEHERFLQALKRYGRAWRKIEEHIGTKTAVQIRSHAQKFFSKLQREQSGSGAGMEDSSNLGISIPPPRPKRKPAHPYPRKHETDSQEPEQSRQSDRDASHPRDSLPSHGPTSRAHSRPQQLHDSFSPRPQLPDGFPALDTRLEPSLSQVLETAAIAAANAWSEVVAGAGSKIRQQLQAHVASHAGIAAAQPFFGMPQQSGAASLPYQLSGLQGMQGPSHPMGQSAQDSPAETTTLENDRDSACSKQYSASRSLPTVLDRQRSTAFKITPGTHIQSAKATGAGVSEARLGRPAWNLTTHTTQAHPQTVAGHTAPNVAPPRSLPRTASAGALPPPGQGTGAAINLNALKTQGSGGQASKPENRGSSVGQSMTPQMAHFYRQAAAHDPENRVTGGSGGEQGSGGSGGGSTGKLDPRRSDKGSNNGNASTSEEDARAEGSGSDNGGQENAQAGGSGDGKGSDDGSNSPAELTQNSTKSAQPSEGDKSATPLPQQQQQQQAGATFRYPGGIDPSLLAHASASLQNQQLLAQTYSGSHLQTSFLAGMNPQTLLSQQQVLANYQQQALSAWAASAHQQQQAKAAALKATTGATTWPTAHQQAPPSKSNSSRAAGTQEQRPGSAADTLQQKASGKLTSISKRSSGGASMDIFRSPSSMSIPLFAPSSSGTGGSGRLGEESSGFQPYSKKQDSGYSKKHSMPLASLPPSKRFAAADASGSRPSSTDTRQGPAPGLYTPFGSSKIQGS